jgi:hypothetical protein
MSRYLGIANAKQRNFMTSVFPFYVSKTTRHWYSLRQPVTLMKIYCYSLLTVWSAGGSIRPSNDTPGYTSTPTTNATLSRIHCKVRIPVEKVTKIKLSNTMHIKHSIWSQARNDQ